MTLLPQNLAEQALALYLADGDDAILAIQALYAPVTAAVSHMADIMYDVDSDDSVTLVRS